ncbi:MAG: calcium/sodium antiporter, partial [Acidimicrobiia bacterium]|nr:calcium/sodium antiporter [Acidimicrobiia bacterium]
MSVALVAIVVGVLVLAWSSDQFVLGAARVALLRNVSALVVGVVIVGFGTSAPEMLVSALAML